MGKPLPDTGYTVHENFVPLPESKWAGDCSLFWRFPGINIEAPNLKFPTIWCQLRRWWIHVKFMDLWNMELNSLILISSLQPCTSPWLMNDRLQTIKIVNCWCVHYSIGSKLYKFNLLQKLVFTYGFRPKLTDDEDVFFGCFCLLGNGIVDHLLRQPMNSSEWMKDCCGRKWKLRVAIMQGVKKNIGGWFKPNNCKTLYVWDVMDSQLSPPSTVDCVKLGNGIRTNHLEVVLVYCAQNFLFQNTSCTVFMSYHLTFVWC